MNVSTILIYKNSSKATKLTLLTTLFFFAQTMTSFAQSGVTALGDSLTAGLTNDGGGRITCLALNGVSIAADAQRTCLGGGRANRGGWQPALSSLVNSDIYNFGNTDETTDEILSRSAQNIASRNSSIVLILGGTNDVIRNVPRSTIINNLQGIINNVIAAGQRPIIGTIPPLVGSRFANRSSALLALNEDIRNLESVEVVDLYDALIDNWAQHNSGDFIHLGTSGNQVVAESWAEKILNPDSDQETINITPILGLLLQGE